MLVNQRGQGLIEYVLVLVVTVALILGGLWQLNTAFKDWANNYFGNYLACLLETGELPNISGGGGDGGLCNDIFQPFTLAGGRKLKPGFSTPEDGSGKPDKGVTERKGGKSYGGASGGAGGGSYAGGSGGGRFRGGSFGKGGRNGGAAAGKKAPIGGYTGSTTTADYGSGGYGQRRKVNAGVKRRLDNHFAFEEERERPKKRSIASAIKKPGDEGFKPPPIRLKRQDVKKAAGEAVDGGLTLPNLLKYLLIAGILIALLVVLGGQGLQINKNME